MKVYQGPSSASDAMIVSSYARAARRRPGAPGAVDGDRPPAADQPALQGRRAAAARRCDPGTWGYAPDVFQAAWDALPDPTLDLDGAKALIQEAGAEGKTIRLGTSCGASALNTEAQAVQSAAEAIGLKAELEVTSAGQLHQLLHRPRGPRARRRLPHDQLRRLRRPGRALSTLVLPDGSQNFAATTTPRSTKELDAARGEADDTKRARARGRRAEDDHRGAWSGSRWRLPTRCWS